MNPVGIIARLVLTVAAVVAVAAGAAGAATAADAPDGKAVYQATCAACHATGAAGAPKLGDADAWAPRFQAGIDGLYRSAVSGNGSMPAKGGNASLSELAVQAAVNFMVLQVDLKPAASKPTATKSVTAAPAKAAPVASAATSDVSAGKGRSVYQSACGACHGTGAAGAPRLADAAAWAPRLKSGLPALYNSALKGKAAMPAKGGNPALADADVKAAVDYLVAQARGDKAAATTQAVALPEPPPKTASAPTATPPPAPATTPATALPALTVAQAPAVAGPPPAQAVAATPAAVADANAFNRLLRAPGKRNLPPAEDGIHDPTNDGTLALQAPLTAFGPFPKSNAGNRIDWVKALAENRIQPRYDRLDPNAVPALMDLNIVREVKGSMPDVVYPHKQHTEWLDCSNCHPAIFIPQKGANQISMAAILLGQKCGVCHGKVAFPVSECRLCHSKNKTAAAANASAK
jgi:c(7)-type cytochrome triheme protein